MLFDKTFKTVGNLIGYTSKKFTYKSKKLISELKNGYKEGGKKATHKNFLKICNAANSNNWFNELHFLVKDDKIDIDSRDVNGNTKLMFLVGDGSLEKIKFFIDYGADIYAKNDFDTDCLDFAIENHFGLQDNIMDKKVKVLEFLLDNYFDVNRKNSENKTPLVTAIENEGHEKIINTLIKKGAKK